jgi:hypothetical protein
MLRTNELSPVSQGTLNVSVFMNAVTQYGREVIVLGGFKRMNDNGE